MGAKHEYVIYITAVYERTVASISFKSIEANLNIYFTCKWSFRMILFYDVVYTSIG